MKTYSVTMPITGHVTLNVQAEDKAGALEAFWERADTLTAAEDEAEDFGWEYCEHVTEGNVTHAETNDYMIEEVKP